jgi:hypothetical protein
MRAFVNKAFTPRRVAILEPQVRAVAGRMPSTAGRRWGQADWVGAAYELPALGFSFCLASRKRIRHEAGDHTLEQVGIPMASEVGRPRRIDVHAAGRLGPEALQILSCVIAPRSASRLAVPGGRASAATHPRMSQVAVTIGWSRRLLAAAGWRPWRGRGRLAKLPNSHLDVAFHRGDVPNVLKYLIG